MYMRQESRTIPFALIYHPTFPAADAATVLAAGISRNGILPSAKHQ